MTKMEVLNKVFSESGFHKFIYDYATMDIVLRKVGFSEVIMSKFRSSSYPDLNVDLDLDNRKIESLYIEAIK
jgi:hypothetical protein